MSTALLPAKLERERRSALASLQRRLRYDLDRGGNRHTTNQTPRRQHVCPTHAVPHRLDQSLTRLQLLLPIHLHHRLHSLPPGHRLATLRLACADDSAVTCLHCPRSLVPGRWSQYIGREWGCEESGWVGGVSAFCVLCWAGLLVLHLVAPSRSTATRGSGCGMFT